MTQHRTRRYACKKVKNLTINKALMKNITKAIETIPPFFHAMQDQASLEDISTP